MNAPRADTLSLAVPEGLTEYEVQVLLGTSIRGSAMHPDRVFNLPAAWLRLRTLGLIDRSDGLAIITEKGRTLVNAMLAAALDPVAAISKATGEA